MTTRGRNNAPTICWECIHSVPNPRTGTGCPWSMDGKPVPGWYARRNDILYSRGLRFESYIVRKCPMFSQG